MRPLKLRTKLILLQVTVFVFLSTIVTFILVALHGKALPLMEQGVRTKVRACIQSLLPVVDVGLAAHDEATVIKAFGRCPGFGKERDEAPRIAVLGVKGNVLAQTGAPLSGLRTERVLTARRRLIERSSSGFSGVAPVEFEGVRLGIVVVAYSTAQIQRWNRWALWLSAVGLLLILGSCLTSILFAVNLIRPLREMIHFVHAVAQGKLGERLQVTASDELADLARDLNTMTGNLRESRQQLSDASRYAGMAEIATHMLHNVGNVLNSVNVSATLSTTKVQGMRILDLVNLAALLEGQPDLTAFFSTDHRAKKLPGFMRLLGEHLTSQRTATLDELRRLQDNVDHIKAIVVTQQKYARSSGLREPVQLQEVIDAALNINLESNRRDGVTVERQCDSLPEIQTDRHKVLQILINLLSNARGATRDSDASDKRILVRAEQLDGQILIAVTDNGTGVTEENMLHVFEHGFTTKQDGHGFGLHSSANAARELGGTLTCSSAGSQQGATFTLRIPAVTGAKETANANRH